MGRVFLNDYSQGRKAPCTGEKGGGLRSFMKNEMGPVGVLPCELYPQKKVLNQKHCGLFYTYWTLYGP